MYTGKEVNMEFTYIHLYMLDLVGEFGRSREIRIFG